MVVVTAALIVDSRKILIAQRKAGSHMELKWEFPGGKLEAGEKPEQCLVREIKEELELDIEVLDIYKVVMHDYDEKTVLLLCYKCKLSGGTANAADCNAFRWVDGEQLELFDYAPADIGIVEKIKNDSSLLA